MRVQIPSSPPLLRGFKSLTSPPTLPPTLRLQT